MLPTAELATDPLPESERVSPLTRLVKEVRLDAAALVVPS